VSVGERLDAEQQRWKIAHRRRLSERREAGSMGRPAHSPRL
jgi:hypothetical protein